jgi:hypothetical protein
MTMNLQKLACLLIGVAFAYLAYRSIFVRENVLIGCLFGIAAVGFAVRVFRS